MPDTPPPHLPDLESRARSVLAKACDREIPICTAESCTGGLLAALLTDCEGYSHIFDRGFVVYSEGAKFQLLGLSRDLIADKGAVSREVAEAMASHALERADARMAVSITGFAGPSKDGEEGLVHLACQREGGPRLHREAHFGRIGRDPVRTAALEVALAMMDEALDE